MPDRHPLTSRRNAGSQEPSGSWLLRLLLPLVVPGAALVGALPALAHEGGSMGISVGVERLPPGAPLPIAGRDFLPGEVLELVLTGPGTNRTLATVPTDGEGHFTVVLQVPASAQPGTYTVDAITRSGIFQRALFTVDSAAPVPAMTMSPVSIARPAEEPATDSGPAVALVAVGAGGLLALAVLGVSRLRRPPGRRRVSGSRRAA